MKRTLALLALLTAPLYAQTSTIGDLPNATSVTATDDFACDQGAATRACTALQIKDLVVTYINSESKLEGVVADMANIIQETEIDTEAELEAILGDVTDLLTDNDTITADAANADAIDAITEIAAALKTGSDLKLVTGTAGSTDDCAKWDANGDLVTAGAACGTGGGATTEAGLESDLTDTTNVLTDNDTVMTSDGAFTWNTSSNGDFTIAPNGTGEVIVESALTTEAVQLPAMVLDDSDTTVETEDGGFYLNCTDAVTAQEDCDILLKQQVNSVLTTRGTLDADGFVLFEDLQIEGNTDCSSIAGEGVPCWETDADKLWIGDGSAPPTEIGAGGSTEQTLMYAPWHVGSQSVAIGTDTTQMTCWTWNLPTGMADIDNLYVNVVTADTDAGDADFHVAIYSADGATQYFEDEGDWSTTGDKKLVNELSPGAITSGTYWFCLGHDNQDGTVSPSLRSALYVSGDNPYRWMHYETISGSETPATLTSPSTTTANITNAATSSVNNRFPYFSLFDASDI